MNSLWFPTINSDECDGCKRTFKCVDFCPYDVLEAEEDRVVVINPLSCIQGCSTCASLCPKDAIIFPTRQSTAGTHVKKSSLLQVVCNGCGKKFSTNKETSYCFDCQKKNWREMV